MPDFSMLAPRVAQARANVLLETQRVVEETAISMLEYLANNTPVDTSKAISNWQVGIGANAWFEIGPHVPGNYGSTKPASVAETIQLGRSVIMGRYFIGSVIHISNQLPYIEGLNNGTISSQPGAFVEGAVLIAELHVASVRVSI